MLKKMLNMELTVIPVIDGTLEINMKKVEKILRNGKSMKELRPSRP